MQETQPTKLSSKIYVFLKSGSFVRRVTGTGAYLTMNGTKIRVVTVERMDTQKRLLVPVSSLQALNAA